MGLRSAQNNEKRLGLATTLYRTATLSLLSSRLSRRAVEPERSGAEGPAVPQTIPGNLFRTERGNLQLPKEPRSFTQAKANETQ